MRERPAHLGVGVARQEGDPIADGLRELCEGLQRGPPDPAVAIWEEPRGDVGPPRMPGLPARAAELLEGLSPQQAVGGIGDLLEEIESRLSPDGGCGLDEDVARPARDGL